MIQGKTAIVTGGSRGIGAATAKKLASLGANIAVIYAGNEAAANAVCEECRAHGVKAEAFQCDVADFAQAKETVALIKEAFGTVDILINCAGITRDKLLAMMREDDFDAVIATNLKGTWNMIRQCCGIFIRNKGGSIVNVSSVVGLTGNAGQSNYSASKAGIIGLTKSTAKELAAKNIRCNAVAPGFIATDMTKDLGGEDSLWLKMIPLARAGEAEEVAEAIVFLADAAYITGEVLRVDGGMAM
jgi:3-oxoacyl-[acyl-carrier protein] reductase